MVAGKGEGGRGKGHVDARQALPDAAEIEHAARLLREGELVALPTETVYGLGADARNPAALAKIFAAKGRPADHPLIVHLADATQLAQWAVDIPPAAQALADAFWPGPLTLILKRHPAVPDLVTGGQDSVGLRVPAHPVALALLRAFGGGIAAPSANPFGRLSPTTAEHVRAAFGETVTVLDGGPCAVGIESTIVDLTAPTPRVLRPGAIGAEEVQRVLRAALPTTLPNALPNTLPKVTTLTTAAPAMHSTTATSLLAPTSIQTSSAQIAQRSVPRVSGSLAAHYAPRTPLRLCAPEALADAVAAALRAGQRVAVLAPASAPPLADHPRLLRRLASADFPSYARELYAALHALDAAGCDLILVAAPPDNLAWQAVNDRLRRAAVGSGDNRHGGERGHERGQ